MSRIRLTLVFALLLVARQSAAATIPDACEATKNKESGKLASCLQAAQGKLVLTGDPVGYNTAVTKCHTKFSQKFDKAEQKAADKGGSCPTNDDGPTIASAISENGNCVAQAVGGGSAGCLLCGNGFIDAGEDCDLNAAGSGTCNSVTAGLLPEGKLGCTANCQYSTSNCTTCEANTGGYCWFLGTVAESCAATCTAKGMSVDGATLTFAGSYAGGSYATNCDTILAELAPASATVLGTPTSFGIGCFLSGGQRFYETSATTTGGAYLTARRACACE